MAATYGLSLARREKYLPDIFLWLILWLRIRVNQ